MKIKAYAITLILVATVLFVSLPKGGGIWLAGVVPLFVIWTFYTMIRMVVSAVGRQGRAIRLGIWVVALVVAIATQAHWDSSARDEASRAAAALVAYKARTGAFPADLADAGLNAQVLADEWHVKYRLREGKPELGYPASLMPLTMYEYDFAANQWRTNAY
jgi:hypothetical protein